MPNRCGWSFIFFGSLVCGLLQLPSFEEPNWNPEGNERVKFQLQSRWIPQSRSAGQPLERVWRLDNEQNEYWRNTTNVRGRSNVPFRYELHSNKVIEYLYPDLGVATKTRLLSANRGSSRLGRETSNEFGLSISNEISKASRFSRAFSEHFIQSKSA